MELNFNFNINYFYIALTYLVLNVTLIYFVRKRQARRFRLLRTSALAPNDKEETTPAKAAKVPKKIK